MTYYDTKLVQKPPFKSDIHLLHQLSHEQPTVDVDQLASDVSGAGGRQKRNRAGDIVATSKPSQGDLTDQRLPLLFGQRAGQIRVDESRCDGIYGDVSRPELTCQSARKADHSRFCRGVIDLPRISHHAHHRGDIDDSAALGAHEVSCRRLTGAI